MDRKVFHWHMDADWEKEKQGFFQGSQSQKFAFACPPEFGGPGGFINPEEIFVAAIATCIMATFINVSKRRGIKVVSYKSHTEAIMEFADGHYRITKAYFRPDIVVSSQEEIEECRLVLHDAESTCPIGKSVTTQVIMEERITA